MTDICGNPNPEVQEQLVSSQKVVAIMRVCVCVCVCLFVCLVVSVVKCGAMEMGFLRNIS